jgi:hypothetical protein
MLNVCRYLLRREASQKKGLRSSKQLTDLQDKWNALNRLIQNWREVQLVYMPHVVTLLLQTQPPPEAMTTRPPTASSPDVLAENIQLFLPSLLLANIRALPELKEICNLEHRLCKPQADDALSKVQRQRCIIQGLWLFKRLNVSGTGNRPNMRMLMLYQRFNNKTDRAAQKYHVAWHALCVLDPGGSWSTWLKELKPKDVSGPGRDPNDSVASNSRYELSWIWLVQHGAYPSSSESETQIHEAEFNQSMRVEWAKARARMMRWKEELMLIQEEMRRVIVYHQWKANWWRERALMQNHEDQVISSGISGYAHKQAAICVRMAEQCAWHWLPHLKARGIVPSWGLDYKHLLIKPQVSLDGNEMISNTTQDLVGVEDLDEEGNEMKEEEECEVDELDYFELDDI